MKLAERAMEWYNQGVVSSVEVILTNKSPAQGEVDKVPGPTLDQAKFQTCPVCAKKPTRAWSGKLKTDLQEWEGAYKSAVGLDPSKRAKPTAESGTKRSTETRMHVSLKIPIVM
ncbi:MAG: hypothetical protein Crog4KO_36140 [Crocinitomicaceae bacterium]